MEFIVKIYFNLIKENLKTIEEVPDNLKDEVTALLNEYNSK